MFLCASMALASLFLAAVVFVAYIARELPGVIFLSDD